MTFWSATSARGVLEGLAARHAAKAYRKAWAKLRVAGIRTAMKERRHATADAGEHDSSSRPRTG